MADKTIQDILHELLSQNYELRAQNLALREALVTFASSVLHKPSGQLLSELATSERHWHQFLLERMEDHNPAIAAAIDQRDVSTVWKHVGGEQPPPTESTE